ncbi:MAG: HAMP domain-containing histidine kinase [Anaerolineae bacterium]|nr:HAMP domain-containing histidine kinase [Anaerolineae bacterium]
MESEVFSDTQRGSLVACPNCSQQVDGFTSYCDHCGVDLAIAAILAEGLVSLVGEPSTPVPIAPEVLVPRLGDYLVENDFITQKELLRALEDQEKKRRNGSAPLLGHTLLTLGYIDRETLDLAVTEQILQLQAALKKSNDHLEKRVADRTAELQNALAKLTELNQLKYNFVSNISHELRTPLAHMMGYLDLLTSQALGSLNDEQVDALSVINKAYHRLEDLIDSLLLFSFASQGELSISPSPVSIREIVQAIHNQLQTKAASRDISFSMQIPDNLPHAMADVEKLTWVLKQLFDNAIKFNRPGGRVECAAESSDLNIRISIEDTGIGIPEEKLSEIFDAFHQLDNSSTRKYGGAGIGLALAQRIIAAHGSTIQVASQPENGARFEFDLPVASP